jgi:hypothetical protein
MATLYGCDAITRTEKKKTEAKEATGCKKRDSVTKMCVQWNKAECAKAKQTLAGGEGIATVAERVECAIDHRRRTRLAVPALRSDPIETSLTNSFLVSKH